MNEEQYLKGGYWKHKLSKPKVELIHSRTIGPDGKVYQGPAGERLKEKKLAKQKWMEKHK